MQEQCPAQPDDTDGDERDERLHPQEHQKDPRCRGGLHQNVERRHDHLVGDETGFVAYVPDEHRAVSLKVERIVGEHVAPEEGARNGDVAAIDEAGLDILQPDDVSAAEEKDEQKCHTAVDEQIARFGEAHLFEQRTTHTMAEKDPGVGNHTDIQRNHPDANHINPCTDKHEHEQNNRFEAILRRKDVEQFSDRLFHGLFVMGWPNLTLPIIVTSPITAASPPALVSNTARSCSSASRRPAHPAAHPRSNHYATQSPPGN